MFLTYTNDNKSIYYIDEGRQFVNGKVKNNKLEERVIAEDATYFWMTGEDNIYYQKQGNTLIYLSKDKEHVISSGVRNAILRSDGKYALYTMQNEDKTLYSVEKGKRKKVLDTDVTDIQPLGEGFIYFKREYEGLSAYITDGKSRGKRVLDGIETLSYRG